MYSFQVFGIAYSENIFLHTYLFYRYFNPSTAILCVLIVLFLYVFVYTEFDGIKIVELYVFNILLSSLFM